MQCSKCQFDNVDGMQIRVDMSFAENVAIRFPFLPKRLSKIFPLMKN